VRVVPATVPRAQPARVPHLAHPEGTTLRATAQGGSFSHSLTHSLTYSVNHTHSHTRSLFHFVFHSLVHNVSHSLIASLTHTYYVTHSFDQSLTHSLTLSTLILFTGDHQTLRAHRYSRRPSLTASLTRYSA
jgi:hypothetical protein